MSDRDTILVISHAQDVHALEVMRHLAARGAKAELLDTSGVAREGRLTIEHTRNGGWSAVVGNNGHAIDMTRVGSVWWRRPQPFDLHPDLGGRDDCNFAHGEISAAVYYN